MTKKIKPLPIKKARDYSQKGRIRRTNAIKNDCINTINRFITAAGEEGETNTGTWFRNYSGFLTPSVIAEIVELFKAEGYYITAEQAEDREGYPENYCIHVKWDAAC